ncbi:MAG: hypothetical protein J6M10_10465, partial [Clostridia bacterium]|nr:hypothetical protein [Clostridia bacterium]
AMVGDLASFHNLDFETAFIKLRSGLVGETEPLMDLGIDMRIAALEEYAGYGVTGLSALEQLQLRYNKLMNDTGDQQGDFLRTQDSFSNQLRIFQTNIEALKATVGDTLLPMANDILHFFNSIFDAGEDDPDTVEKLNGVTEAFDEFSAAAATAEEHYSAAEKTIEARANLAETYMTTLETLEGKEIKTDEDIAAINNAIAALNNLYPQLELYFDPATGKISQNTQAIRDNIKAMQDLAIQELFSEKQQAAAQGIAQAYDELATATATLEEAQAPLDEVDQKISGVQGLIQQLQENGFQGVNTTAGEFAALIPEFDQYFQRNLDGSWSAMENPAVSAMTILTNAENQLTKLNEDRAALIEGVEAAQAAVEGYNQAIADLEAKQQEITDQMNRVQELMYGSGEDAAENEAQGVSDNAGVVADAVEKMSAEAAEIDTSIYANSGRRAAHAFAMGALGVKMPTLRIGTSTAGGQTDGSHATGLDWVPYDNYLARLHVGEAVLTASEAQKWRSGGGIDAGALASGIAAAINETDRNRPVIINVNGKQVARILASDTARAGNAYSQSIARGVGK